MKVHRAAVAVETDDGPAYMYGWAWNAVWTMDHGRWMTTVHWAEAPKWAKHYPAETDFGPLPLTGGAS